MVEVMKIMMTSLKDPRHVLLKPMPPTLQHATTDPHFSWKLPDTLRQVSCWVTVPGSWCTRFFVPAKSLFSQSCLSSGCSMVGLMSTSSKRTSAIPTPRVPVLAADHGWPVPPQEMLKHRSVSVSVGSLDPNVYRVCLSPLSFSGRNGVCF